MKAILSTIGALAENPPRIKLVADSAIGRQCEPYWLDNEHDIQQQIFIAPCYRIGRLGKNIDRKFALRYIDGITLAAIIVPQSCTNAMEVPDIFLASSSAVIPGNDISPDTLSDGQLSASADRQNLYFNWQEFATEAVAKLSEYTTFKTGDRIIDCSNPMVLSAVTHSHIEALLNNSPILRFKVI